MKHDNLLAGWRRLVVAAGLATLGSVLVITTSFAQSSANCRAYAEDYSRSLFGAMGDVEFQHRAAARRRQCVGRQ